METIDVTLDPNDKGTGNSLSNGDLTVRNTTSNSGVRATNGKITGKWYWEVKLDSGNTWVFIGISNKSFPIGNFSYSNTNWRSYYGANARIYPDSIPYGTNLSVGEIIGIALDLDNGTLEFYKNGVSMGVSHTNVKELGEVYPTICGGNTADSKVVTINFGATPFIYSVPSGFLAYGAVNSYKFLVQNNLTYMYHNGSRWEHLTGTPTEQEYLNYGMDDSSTISESAWSELQGDVEILYWTNDQSISEVQFNIETEPFTLEDEFAGSVIKIIEYTDDPNQTESSITLETEPFTVYDELGDTVDVLYYTDDPSRTSADLEIVANYSPLDAIEGDFEVVTWTDETDKEELNITVEGLPLEQIIISNNNNDLYGEVKEILLNKVVDTGTIKTLFSFDNGITWETFKYNKWAYVDINDTASVKAVSMSLLDLKKVDKKMFEGKGNRLKMSYYIEESGHITKDELIVRDVSIKSLAPINGVKFNSTAFYLLNTTATINLTFAGNKISGVLDDEDKGKVQYRVYLNGEAYYPENGEFTRLADSPMNINLIIDDRKIRFGVDNTLKVEFMDYWGQVDSWITTFVGTHAGLVFTDESGSFYTTAFGEVLKYLDFGTIVAGQTTLDYKVIMQNNIGYDVENIEIKAIQPNLNGVTIELSKEQSPFVPLSELLYPTKLKIGEAVEFAVRVATSITADTAPLGKFELRVNADRVV